MPTAPPRPTHVAVVFVAILTAGHQVPGLWLTTLTIAALLLRARFLVLFAVFRPHGFALRGVLVRDSHLAAGDATFGNHLLEEIEG